MQHSFRLSELPQLSLPDRLFDIRFIHAQNFTVAFNELKAGAEVPLHQHIHETIDYVQEGTLQLTIGNETIELIAGSVAHVPSNIWHSARAISDCKVISIFYPCRDDFRADNA